MNKYGAFIALFVVGLVTGSYLSFKFYPGSIIRTVNVPSIKTVTQTKVIERYKDGTVIEKIIVEDKAEVKPSPLSQYRLGVLLPISDDRLPTITASKRLFKNLWIESQYNLKHKEALIGLSLEF